MYFHRARGRIGTKRIYIWICFSWLNEWINGAPFCSIKNPTQEGHSTQFLWDLVGWPYFVCWPIFLNWHKIFWIYIYIYIYIYVCICTYMYTHTHMNIWPCPWHVEIRGLNPCHSSDLSHIRDNTGSWTHCATRELLAIFLSYNYQPSPRPTTHI